jgi:tRNA-2-methylthio-N6-dimethylallyladenosine synthase
VPYTRGEEVSRPMADVMRDVAALVAQGVKEVTLLGQNVNAYCGMTDDGEMVDFAFLLQAIAALEGIGRIRYSTSHPKEMTQRLIDVYATTPKLVSHLHLPVQSGSDRILAAMKRGHTALEYKSIIRRVRAVRPDILLWAFLARLSRILQRP